MADKHPLLREWLIATSVFALITLAGATSVDFLLTNGLQWGVDPVSVPLTRHEGTF
jgi:hypothetical protein